jgi:hypothetical protein
MLSFFHVPKKRCEVCDACCIGFTEFDAFGDLKGSAHACDPETLCSFAQPKNKPTTVNRDRLYNNPFENWFFHPLPGTDQLRRLTADVRQQGHKASTFDGFGNSVLAGSITTRLAAPHDAAVTIDQFLEQLDILVVDVHWPWSYAINKNRILFT